ncbi:MAG: serine/threonine protein kinase [Eubacterium sp.]|nr:serine/threonine protein kinase [Eubacterium sp.]
MLEIGTIVAGRYKILSVIGQGGMSTVYLAHVEKANKSWAIKEVRKDGTMDQEKIRQNLIAETDILKKLHHAHLPSIVDVIDKEDTYLIVMDYVEGVTLKSILDEKGPQPQELVLDWAMQLCDVMDCLHSQNPAIIYRDCKPSNIMLKPNGDIVLIDFGTAREYKEFNDEDTRCLGTRGYAAPEQFGGHGQTDARTDIYNIGATLYHLITGKSPGMPPYEMKPIRKWNPLLSEGLEKIILKCTEQDPGKRYQTCSELMYDLEHYTDMESGYRNRLARRWRMFLALCTASFATLVGGVFCNVQADKLTNNNYQSYMKLAESATSDEAKYENYSKAIKVSPSSGKAYTELLDSYLSDGSYSKEEADNMTELLGYIAPGGRKSNEEMLKSNDADYSEFAFKMGLAYFYYYESTGNKQMSKPWFEIAKNSTSLSDDCVVRSRLFYKIADYYQSLNMLDRAGDSKISYKNYWEDLTKVTAGNLVEKDNLRTALIMYQELTGQSAVHTKELKDAGIKEEDIKKALEAVNTHLHDDVVPFVDGDTDKVLLNRVKKNIQDSMESIRITYSGTEAERKKK